MFFKHLRPQREINNKNRVAGCSNQSRLIPHMPACCPLSIHFSCTLLDATATELFVDQARLADTLLSTSAIMKPPPICNVSKPLGNTWMPHFTAPWPLQSFWWLNRDGRAAKAALDTYSGNQTMQSVLLMFSRVLSHIWPWHAANHPLFLYNNCIIV